MFFSAQLDAKIKWMFVCENLKIFVEDALALLY